MPFIRFPKLCCSFSLVFIPFSKIKGWFVLSICDPPFYLCPILFIRSEFSSWQYHLFSSPVSCLCRRALRNIGLCFYGRASQFLRDSPTEHEQRDVANFQHWTGQFLLGGHLRTTVSKTRRLEKVFELAKSLAEPKLSLPQRVSLES